MKKRRWEPSTPLFKQLNLLKLSDINNLNTATFVFKAINRFIPSPIDFMPRQAGPYNLRRHQPLIVPLANSKQTQRFLRIRGSQLWNELSPHIRQSRTVESFKNKLKKFYLSQYTLN